MQRFAPSRIAIAAALLLASPLAAQNAPVDAATATANAALEAAPGFDGRMPAAFLGAPWPPTPAKSAPVPRPDA